MSNEEAIDVVLELTKHIDTRNGGSFTPIVEFHFSKGSRSILIGGECVWNSEADDEDDLSFDFCLANWRRYVEDLATLFEPGETEEQAR